MKKLQNNFTTPEQSKRLLELGVPVDSADCVAHILDNSADLYEDFFLKGDVRISVINERHTYTKVTTLEDNEVWLDEPYPCWSVGRLMEIFHICISHTSIYGWNYHEDVDGSYIDYIIQEYIDALKYEELNFSKLEE